MKKLLFLVAAFGMLFTACEYDDSAINGRIDDLENRVTELEETIAALNQDIAGVQTLVGAMQNNVYVSKIVKGETGYEVYFTNGEKITIADGKAGEAGKDGVTVTIMLDEDGQYYWAVTKDGVTNFLLDENGNKLPVKGEKGNTPLMRVVMEGETGYWEASYDNGETWERILLEDGTPVTTSGGAGGLFKDAYIDEETNSAIFVFLNGEQIVIPLGSELYINFEGEAVEKVDFKYGETQTFQMKAAGVLKTVVTTPDEWKASYDKETMVWTITAPTAEHAACADTEGEVSIIYFGDENQSSVVTVAVAIGEYVTVADEHLTIEATADEATYEVPYTADGDVTVEQVDAWISATLADGVASIQVAANSGAARTGTIKLVAKSNVVVITVNQPDGVKLLPYGYRAGSEEILFAKPLSEITGLSAAAANRIAVTNDYVIVSATNETPVVLNATTGEYVGTLNLGDLAGKNAAITADDAGNIIVSTLNDNGYMRIARMKSIDATPEIFIEKESTEYGGSISVIGDVYDDAIITLMYAVWSQGGTTGHWRYIVTDGVPGAVYWSKIAAGDTGATLNNTKGDVIYRDMGAGAPYFMTGYSSNCFIWAENGTALAVQPTTNSNCGAVCIDVEQFNGAYYLMTAADTYFTWDTSYAYLADVTTIDNFKAGIITYTTGDYGWSVKSNVSGNTDCALKVSKDGVYMYAYVLYAGGSLGCIRVDCLDK
ncbi:MAG: DUF5018 domain-containing protein [Alistipes sp.]|nr:DUF5018 domain-containing protein [Alistipes sp.]